MSACPYCFTPLVSSMVVYRCTGGCPTVHDEQASAIHGGKRVSTPPLFTAKPDETGKIPKAVQCARCSTVTTQQVCPNCHEDLPEGWRSKKTFTMAVTGARGSGKSVYIAVLIAMLQRYADRHGISIEAVSSTADLYKRNYYERVFANKALSGTTPGFDDVMRWEVKHPDGSSFSLIVRDVAGEDIERLSAEANPAFGFIDWADLTIFLFDPLMLYQVKAKLDGVIATVDDSRLGDSPEEALPKVLAQTRSGHSSLALVISKFDSLHQLAGVGARDELAYALANPAAHFNWDRTPVRAQLDAGVAAADLEQDLAFLDGELRALLSVLSDESVTNRADIAVRNSELAAVRHFAVSSVGDSAQHAEQLTLRGVSPFRVLDPVLWGMGRAGYTI